MIRIPATNRSLPIALLRARERVMGPIRTMLAGVGITEQQWRVLRVLDEAGPMDPTRIATEACLLLPSLTRILQKLEDKELIVRRRDLKDRRRQIIDVSDAGRQLIIENIEFNRKLTAATRDRLGEAKYNLLLDLLNELDRFDEKAILPEDDA